MQVYLAGRMTGLPQLNFPAFNDAAEKLRAMGHDVFNPADLGTEITYRDALGIDLAWICDYAEAIALLPGWEHSPGSRVEHELARALNLRFIYL